ncbi:Zinc transporter 1 [Morella rubra]|uniref:Zinc transporter 1 n=1 Tax=Morella rubra TaxID=262757 RepID=A0A6A1VZ91_9ROSI|nr:Zinc transporter 1 [Morella rubra]
MVGILFLLSLFLPTISGDCTCDANTEEKHNSAALHYKLGAIASILLSSVAGVCLPMLGKKIPALRPENDFFFVIKAFAAGVILATGFIHILPDSFADLTSPCLNQNPWGNFPFSGFFAMLASIATLMVDAYATGYYTRLHFQNQANAGELEAGDTEDEGHVHVHTHAAHGHAHGVVMNIPTESMTLPELTRHRIIAQAEFKTAAAAIMATFFSLTTPLGAVIGIGISSTYNENSPTSLIVEGTLNGLASGILIYMALVDLLAADFMNPRLQNNFQLQVWVNAALLLGAGCMSLLAKWA